MEIVDNQSSNKLRLSSKRLKSGMLQVRFELSGRTAHDEYGYLLTEPKTSLKEVVHKIFQSFDNTVADRRQRHLFSIGRAKQTTEMLIIR
jgi:hypothetical protein